MYVRSFFGVSAGASLRERKSTSDFPNPPASRPVSSESKKNKRPYQCTCVRFLVCPPGLEPGPGASEGVKSYTLCIFLRFFFDFSHISMLLLV